MSGWDVFFLFLWDFFGRSGRSREPEIKEKRRDEEGNARYLCTINIYLLHINMRYSMNRQKLTKVNKFTANIRHGRNERATDFASS